MSLKSRLPRRKPHPCEFVELKYFMDDEVMNAPSAPGEDEQMYEVEKIIGKTVKEGITYY